MGNDISLTNHFLIAMPQLNDPNFFHTVTYICQHDEEGAMGIIINRPIGMNMGEVYSHLEIDCDDAKLSNQPIFFGGPVQCERGFVLHRGGNWEGTMEIAEDLSLTTSSDILGDIAQHNGPNQNLVALGYAGWGAGQLEEEMAANAWLSVPANSEIIFDLPVEKRWKAAATLLGVNLELISEEVGHA